MISLSSMVFDAQNAYATVVFDAQDPRYTNEPAAQDATARIAELLPGLAGHACFGDDAPVFGEVMEQTEVAHLLEHITVELLAASTHVHDVVAGQTTALGDDSYELTFKCFDDVLVASAVSSALWILNWALDPRDDVAPNVEAIVAGIDGLIDSLPTAAAAEVAEATPEAPEDDEAATDADATVVTEALDPEAEASDDVAAEAAEDVAAEASEEAAEATPAAAEATEGAEAAGDEAAAEPEAEAAEDGDDERALLDNETEAGNVLRLEVPGMPDRQPLR